MPLSTPLPVADEVNSAQQDQNPEPKLPRTLVDFKSDLQALGFLTAPDGNSLIFKSAAGYTLTVVVNAGNWPKSTIDYGPDIQVHHTGVTTFRQPESLVVLTCVISLLKKGYQPRLIEL